MTSCSPRFLFVENPRIIKIPAIAGGKTLALGWVLRLFTLQCCVERGMPSGFQPSQLSDNERPRKRQPDRAAAQSAALKRLRDSRDRTAFEELYIYFAPRLVVFFERRGLDSRRSQEAMQDVMAKIWEKAALFDSRKSGASTWIFTLARNRLIDVIRKDKRSIIDFTDPSLAPDQPTSPDQALQEKDRALALQRAISELPADQATVLKGMYIDGLKQSELAEKLGVPLNTVKSRLRLALSKMRASLEVSQ